MENEKTILDMSHYNLFLVLDILKKHCEIQNANESLAPIKYADIFNFAVTCKKFRRIVWDWDKSMYHELEIDLLFVVPHKTINVAFAEIHKSLEGATKQKREQYMDIYIKALMGNPLLHKITLIHTNPDFNSDHSSVFDEIVMALHGKAKRITLDSARMPKIKEIIVDIADREISDLYLFRNISKLSLTASIQMSDLEEFCRLNPTLVTLEVNSIHFSDCGKLTQIVPHCPNLKQLKFQANDNLRDNDNVKLSLLNKLQKLEIVNTINLPKKLNFLLPDKNEEEWQEDQSLEMSSECASLIGGVSTLRTSTPILQLLRAFSEKKKSALIQLRIGFDIDDEMAQAIVNVKGLRMLECGFCDPKSIRHMVRHATLNRLSILSKGPLVTDYYAALLEKQVTVSNLDSKMYLNARGYLYIQTENAHIFSRVDFEPFLKLKNLKNLILPVDMLVSMESTLPQFLELGVCIRSEACEIVLDPQKRKLHVIYEIGYYKDVHFSMPTNLRCVELISLYMPTTHLLQQLSTHNIETLQELYIGYPDRDSDIDYLNKDVVEALSTLKCLRTITCGFQKLIYILPLARLKELGNIEVLSEHHPKNVNFSRCLDPLLRNCPKLSSFRIKVPVDGITKKLLNSLENVVAISRVKQDIQEDLDIHIFWIKKPHSIFNKIRAVNNLTDKQLKLIRRPLQRIKLTVEQHIESDNIF
ncbi:uncharacterized protein LOC122617135 isoform X2 [Drosophila teissieri]|uniref:uncharacterized protein LOC122617135 isoform X2 n=1 Tax=Drosophila teissieri TaxID=7243 RepID=UPI001CB9F38D|nr:uncharacterized protein LOC122617135 isoform X2 [Drosophila teissieri]